MRGAEAILLCLCAAAYFTGGQGHARSGALEHRAGDAPVMMRCPLSEVLTVSGEAIDPPVDDREPELTVDALSSLPRRVIRTATPWDRARDFEGPLLAEVLRAAGARSDVTTIRVYGRDDSQVDISVNAVSLYRPILATTRDGVALTPAQGGPLWLIFPMDTHPELRTPAGSARFVSNVCRIDVR